MAQRPSRVYQILVMLIYGDYPWLERYGSGVMEFRLMPFARLFEVRNRNVRDALRWLKEKNFLLELELQNGEARVKLAPPKKLFDSFDVVSKDYRNEGEGI